MAAGQISFLSFINILVTNKLKFVIEIAERWDNHTILRLTTACGYPHSVPFIKKGDSLDQDNMTDDQNEVRNKLGGQVLAYYDTGTQRVIGATKSVYDLISETKKAHLDKLLRL